jgi:hypothetical protein
VLLALPRMRVSAKAVPIGRLFQEGTADVGVAWAAVFGAERVCDPRVRIIIKLSETLVSRSKMVCSGS